MFNSYIEKISRILLGMLKAWFVTASLPHDHLPLSDSVVRSALATRIFESNFETYSIVKRILKTGFSEVSDGTLNQLAVEISTTCLLAKINKVEILLRHLSRWMYVVYYQNCTSTW